ncbi:MAG: formimidoylglutamase [Proteobacteria bacterium]|nr:MAG: formimidoylglutamase [Pseudomonadota bacterium]
MYKKPNKKLWIGRIDREDREFGKRWHEKINFISPPFKKRKKKSIAFLGFDCDEGVRRNKGRVGAANACDKLKNAIGNFAFHLDKTNLYDAGKVVASKNLGQSQKELAFHVTKLLDAGYFPIVFGGGHETAYGSFMGLFDSLRDKNDIAIINFDAHFDLRISKQGTSGTPFAQIAKLCKKNSVDFNYMCLGISKASNTKALFKKAHDLNVKYILDTKMTYNNLQHIKKQIKKFLKNKKYLYITIDVDVFCPYSVFAVSAPSYRGIELNISCDILAYLFGKYKNKIKLMDFAEFNPRFDIQDISKSSIARLIYDAVELKVQC